VSGIESDQVTDLEIRELRDEVATPEMNQDINQKVQNEELDRISEEKENEVDGETTNFFLGRPHYNELKVADKNNDGVVNGSDIEVFVEDDGDRRTEFQVTLIDEDRGEFELLNPDGSALENGEIYVEYSVTPLSQDGYGTQTFDPGNGPHPLIETACAQLTASYAFTNVEASKLKDFSIGNVTINNQSEAPRIMREEYMRTRKRINQTQLAQTRTNENSTTGVFTQQGGYSELGS
jgi:hypothetical protein